MALQLKKVANWTDRFNDPNAYEASVRGNLAQNNIPLVQQAVRQAGVPSPAVRQQMVQQPSSVLYRQPIRQHQQNDIWNALSGIGNWANQNFIQPTLTTIGKSANQIGAAGAGLYGLGDIALNGQSAARRTRENINYFLGKGIGGVGGYQRPDTVGKDAGTSIVKPIVQATSEIAPLVIPIGKVGQTGNLAVRAGKQAIANAAVGGSTNVATQLVNDGKIDPAEAAKAALISGAIGGAAPIGGALVNKAKVGLKGKAPQVNTQQEASTVIQSMAQQPEVKLPKAVVKQSVEIAAEKPKMTPAGTKRGTTETSIDPSDPFNNRSLINRIKNELGQAGEKDFQMLSMLKKIEKETGKKGLVDQYYYDTGRIRASSNIADAKLRDSQPLKEALGGLKKKELDALDTYAGARAELNNYGGKKTSRSTDENAAIVSAGNSKYADRFEALNAHYKDQARQLAEAGIISGKKLQQYLSSDNYIRIQRDVEDLVNPGIGSSMSKSFKSTSTSQKRTGSERAIVSPTRSLLKRAQQTELEIQRNKAATNTIDMLQEFGLAKMVNKPTNKNTIGRFVNGKKELYEVPGDIKQAMESVNPHIQGVTAQIISAPVRLLRSGATGLSAPFAIGNYIRDQVGSGIQSKAAWSTHNPVNIIKSLGSAARDFGDGSTDPLWKKFEEFSGNQTIYDELRNAKGTNEMLRELRMGERGKLINKAISPVRTLEDFIGITEKATRFQNFKGVYTKTLKETGNEQEALKQATLAARKNSTDFSRSGDFTRTMNLFIPYFNASVQGTRTMARAFKERPIATSVKTLTAVALPSVAATLYNYADPERRKAYESINDFEKKDNFIVVGPDAHQKSDGSWEGVVKIPKPPGYRELTDPVRDVTEAFAKGSQSLDVSNMLQDVLASLSGPVQTGSPEQAFGSLLPQQVKPFVQLAANKDFYTGRDTVNKIMQEETDNPAQRAYTDTSGSARILADRLGVSPIQIEKFIKDVGASVGQYALNAVDTAGAQAGLFPGDQIGGRSPLQDVTRRFGEATGSLLEENKTPARKFVEARNQATSGLDKNELSAYQALHPKTKNFLGEQMYEADSTYNPAARLDIYNRFPKVFEADKNLDQFQRRQGNPGNPLFDLKPEQVKKVLEKDNLPPGAKDPELSNLRTQDWYAEYQSRKGQYFDQLATKAKAEDRPFGTSDNPYPVTPPETQQIMDFYNSLPKGTGARSSWIKANPKAWATMQNQFAAVDNWQNKQRTKRGLDTTEGEEGAAKGYLPLSSGNSSGFGSRRPMSINEYGYTVKRNSVDVKKSKTPPPKKSVAYTSKRTSRVKPKVSLKKATA